MFPLLAGPAAGCRTRFPEPIRSSSRTAVGSEQVTRPPQRETIHRAAADDEPSAGNSPSTPVPACVSQNCAMPAVKTLSANSGKIADVETEKLRHPIINSDRATAAPKTARKQRLRQEPGRRCPIGTGVCGGVDVAAVHAAAILVPSDEEVMPYQLRLAAAVWSVHVPPPKAVEGMKAEIGAKKDEKRCSAASADTEDTVGV